MSLHNIIVILLILIPAGWRLSSLFANENGPFKAFSYLRYRVVKMERRSKFWRAFHLYEGLTCEWCNSIWFGSVLIILYYFFGDAVAWPASILTLSTGVITIKHVIQYLAALTAKLEYENAKHASQANQAS